MIIDKALVSKQSNLEVLLRRGACAYYFWFLRKVKEWRYEGGIAEAKLVEGGQLIRRLKSLGIDHKCASGRFEIAAGGKIPTR